MRYSGGGNLTARVVPVRIPLGFERVLGLGLRGFPNGAVALMRRGTCPFSQKAANAQGAGAAPR